MGKDTKGNISTPVNKVANHDIFMRYLKRAIAPPAYLNPSYTVFSEKEGERSYKIATNINEMNFRGMTVNAIMSNINGNVNKLVSQNVEVKKQAYFTQLRMDWNNVFMVPPNQPQRLNNPMQESYMRQKQMSVPNVYQQFYAFMKALSAAFGTLQ